MIIIFGNIRDILKRCRGLFKINYIWWEGLYAKRENMKGLFGKKGYKEWGSLVNRGKVGGFWAKALLLPLPTLENRGGGGEKPAAPERRPWGLGGGHGEGKRERGPRETRSPPRFGPGRSEEVGPRRL